MKSHAKDFIETSATKLRGRVQDIAHIAPGLILSLAFWLGEVAQAQSLSERANVQTVANVQADAIAQANVKVQTVSPASALSERGPGTRAASLLRDFQSALAFDAEWRRALAIRDGALENEVQGLAGLLPQVQATAQRSTNSTRSELSRVGQAPVTQDISGYPAYQYVLQARQPLLRIRSLYGFFQGQAQAAAAQANLIAARQDLALRLIAVLADWSLASALMQAAQLQLDAADADALLARQRLAAGDGTRVDLETALARRAQALAALADAKAGQDNNRMLWQTITGLDDRSQPLLLSQLVDQLPAPHQSQQALLDQALQADGQIRALELAIEVAQFEIKKARSDHYPTLDLLAQKSIQNSSNDFTIGNRYETTYVGVQLAVPIYSGGAVQSAFRQAQTNLRRAQEELAATKNRITVALDRDWRSLQTAKLEAQAARQAFEAATVVLRASDLGQRAGIAILNERLIALAQQSASIRDLARANNRALAAWARLMASVGKLNEDSLLIADQWLAEWQPSSALQTK